MTNTKRIATIGGVIATTITVIALAVSNAAVPTNDIILTANNSGTLTINQIGSVDDPIIVDGGGFTVKCLVLSGQYIEAKNFVIDGCPSHGAWIKGQDIVFENSIVRHSVTENGAGKCTGANQWGSAVKVYMGAYNVTIRGNSVYENCGEGIGVTRGRNVLVENNIVYDNFSVDIYIDNSYNVQVLNNHTYYTTNPNYWRDGSVGIGIGLGLENYSGWGTQLHDILIDGNRIENARRIGLYSQFGAYSPANTTISNNTFLKVTAPFVNVPGAVVSNNVSGVAVTGTPFTSTPITITTTRTATKTPTQTPTKLPTSTATADILLTPTCDPVYIPAGVCIYFIK